MSRNSLFWVGVTCALHAALAVGGYAAMRVAERIGSPVFDDLERVLVFADVPLYFSYANRAFQGEIPYRDYAIEYPPLALPFLFAPRLVARTQAAFVALFAVEMLLLDFLLVGLVARWVERTEGGERVPARLAWLTVAFATVAPFAIGRYDCVPALLGFASACAWFGGRPGWGGALAAIGGLAKIAPAAVAPIGFLFESPRRGLLAFVIVAALGLGSWLALGGHGVVDSMRYHSERGVEIGSLPSGWLWCASRLGNSPLRVVHDHQSLNLVTRGSDLAARLALPIQAGLMLAVSALFALGGHRDPMRFAGASVLAFAIGGKVLSPQYLLWVAPFVAVVGGRAGRMTRPLFLTAGLLTMALYPWAFGALRRAEPWAFAALNARNAALIACLAALVLTRSGPPGAISE